MSGFKMHSTANDNRLVEGEPWLGAVPVHKFVDGVPLPSLCIGARQTAQKRGFRNFQVCELNTSRPTIARWKTRFEKTGIAGLEAWHKGSKAMRVEGGTLVWPNGADLCPDVLIWGGLSPAETASDAA